MENEEEIEEVYAKTDKSMAVDRIITDDFAVDADTLRLYEGLSPTTKRRLTRFSKADTGIEDAESKQLLPAASLNTAYGLLDVIIPPYNLDELAGFYDSSYANHAAVNAKVSNSVSLGYGFEVTQVVLDALDNASSESAKKKAHSRIERQKIALEEWLESLNSDNSFTHVLEMVMTDYNAVGNGYLEIGRISTGPRKGEIGYVGHVPATTIRVRRKRDGFVQIVNQNVTFFRNFQDKDTPNPIVSDRNTNEIIHLKKYTPKNSYYGVPDMVSAAAAVVGDQLAGKYNLDYFENKAVPRYVVTLQGAKLSRQAESELFRFLQAGLKGQNHRTLYIPLPGDTQDNKVKFDMKAVEAGIQEGSFDKYRRSNRDDILVAHGVPVSKVGGGAGISIAAALASDRTFKEQDSRPTQRTIEKVVTRIIKEVTDMFKFKLNELSLTDENTQSQIDERYLRMQVYVPNEVRDRMGMPMREGGDKPVELKPQQNADNTQRARDRNNNASDSTGTDTGRNAQGEGRKQP